jgi:cytochrome c biogenesis protein CcmG/thiol:disulfide interchange protein DsbE
VPSPFIGKPAPSFQLTQLANAEQTFSPQQMQGQVWLLNVWASWCVACRIEHPLLVDLAKKDVIPIVGLNYKDKRDAASGWLMQFGNPYKLSVVDADGRVGLDYGVYGVPETFVIDKAGVIRFKQIGPITEDVWRNKMLPLVQQLRKS